MLICWLGWRAVKAIDTIALLIADNFTIAKRNNAFAKTIYDPLIVGRNKNCSTKVVNLFKQVNNLFGSQFIKLTSRLVGNEDFWLTRDGTCN